MQVYCIHLVCSFCPFCPFHQVVIEAVFYGRKKNGLEGHHANRHFHRSRVRLMTEFFERHKQLQASQDDMNIIQVGRPAVSRYHQCRKFFLKGKGNNFATHDFPTARYGIKCSGIMVHKHKGEALERHRSYSF